MKQIPGYPCYSINEDGDILSVKRTKPRLMKKAISPQGYQYVTLWHNKQGRKITVHRLVAETFIPNPDNKRCVNHIDGDKLNNRVDNLEWCDHGENNKHAFDAGLRSLKGERHSQNILTEDNVREIRKLRQSTNLTQKQIGQKFGVSMYAVCDILRGKNWSHVK